MKFSVGNTVAVHTLEHKIIVIFKSVICLPALRHCKSNIPKCSFRSNCLIFFIYCLNLANANYWSKIDFVGLTSDKRSVLLLKR